jgi:prevent-host-death family protein
MPVTMPVSELQRNFKSTLDKCEHSSEPYFLTRNGKASLVVMSAEAYNERMAELDAARSHEAQVKDDIIRGYEDYLAGRCLPADEAFEAVERARGMR